MKKGLFTILLCGIIVLASIPTYASSNTKTTKNSALSATLKSNCWIQTLSDLNGGGDFQVSAEYNSTNANFRNPEWIKTEWNFYSYGLGVGISVSGISGSIGGNGTSGSSGHWINSNGARSASFRGRVYATGLSIYVGLTNTATAFKAGVPLSVTAKI